MSKSVLVRLTDAQLREIKANVAYDPASPNGLSWLTKRKGRRPTIGKTVWIGPDPFQAAHLVMILNEKWPKPEQTVVTRIDKTKPWSNVENLKWSTHAEATEESRAALREQAIRNVLGSDIPIFSEKERLSALCRKGHRWNGYALTLQVRQGAEWKCKECAREKSVEQSRRKPRTTDRRWHPELRGLPTAEHRCAYKRMVRERLREQGLTARGTAPVNARGGVLRGKHNEALALEAALRDGIRAAGRCPSVARLVMNEQQRYWREHPEAKREHDKQWRCASWWLRYQIDPDLRLYVRQKSKRRKALLREQMAHQIKPKQLRARFAQFDNRCAYCGDAGDMQIEHVVAISKGGTHAIGNIVPACRTCNYSKREHEVERWYRAQPQFSEKRWKRICRVLGWDRGSVGQLALL